MRQSRKSKIDAMIPNFVQQIYQVEKSLETHSATVANFWKDGNQEKFYSSYMNTYESEIDLFVNGGTGNYSMGLDRLLAFLDQKEREMEELGRLH